jgi:hypothetical protein
LFSRVALKLTLSLTTICEAIQFVYFHLYTDMQIPPKYQLLYIQLRKGILANTTRKTTQQFRPTILGDGKMKSFSDLR